MGNPAGGERVPDLPGIPDAPSGAPVRELGVPSMNSPHWSPARSDSAGSGRRALLSSTPKTGPPRQQPPDPTSRRAGSGTVTRLFRPPGRERDVPSMDWLYTMPKKPKRSVRITHIRSGEVIAEGPVGWGITPFEGNWYISTRFLRTDGFTNAYVPGLCPYKFVYLWLHFRTRAGGVSRFLGWRYVLPNPLFPFIAFRVAVPGDHPELEVSLSSSPGAATGDENADLPHDPVGAPTRALKNQPERNGLT